MVDGKVVGDCVSAGEVLAAGMSPDTAVGLLEGSVGTV